MSGRIGFNIVSAIILATGSVATVFAALLLVGQTENASLPYIVLVAGMGLSGWLSLAPRVANQWEQAVVLRLGRFVELRGPGLFWVLPLFDRVAVWIDLGPLNLGGP